MTGFTTDFVNQIAVNLRDRYRSGFPILKELVQNADDAGARSLAFGFHAGFGDAAAHPLLHGPALWVFNDGRFTDSDRRAIRSFGLNAKAGDVGTIGKFGLGMKSVFHLCEGFFYAAHDGTTPTHDFLNPWRVEGAEGPAAHGDWDRFEERDAARLAAVARQQKEFPARGSWFLLWVPLRMRAHVAGPDGARRAAIIERYPGEHPGEDLDFFSDPEVDRRIGALLPLLRNLRQVRFAGAHQRPAFRLVLEARPAGLRLDHLTDGLRIAGAVKDERRRGEQLQFVARQHAPGAAVPFARLRAASAWPASMVQGTDGRREPRPDKAAAEAALMFAHADGRGGRLELQWAVFLPAEDARFRYEAGIPGGRREYRIVLHGQFFVDAGRRGIADMDALELPCEPLAVVPTQAQVLRQWNQALAQQVVLPQFLPGLRDYVAHAGLGDDETRALTLAITQCTARGDGGSAVSFFTAFRPYLCAQRVWIRRLRPQGAGWELVDAGHEPVLSLPGPPAGDAGRPWRALPGLAALPACAFADAGAPRLAAALAPWTGQRLLVALAGVSAQTLESATDLEYLADFLAQERGAGAAAREDAGRDADDVAEAAGLPIDSGPVQQALVQLFRRALGGARLPELRRHPALLQRLLAVLAPDLFLALGPRDGEGEGTLSDPLFRALCQVEAQALLVPGDLAPAASAPPARPQDLLAWLTVLDAQLNATGDARGAGSHRRAVLAAAGELLHAAGRESVQAELMRAGSRLRVLAAQQPADPELDALSLEELAAAHRAGELFRVTDAQQPLGCTPQLAAALPGVRWRVLRAPVASLVDAVRGEEERRVPACTDVAAALRAAGGAPAAPALGPLAARAELVRLAATARLDDAAAVRALRYLLHGDPAHYLGSEPLFKDTAGRSAPWMRLWRMVDDEPWRVLPEALCALLPDRHAVQVGVRAVEERAIQERLRQCTDFSRVDARQFTPEEIDRVLGRVADERAWRALPLHRDYDGRYRAADADCHLGREPRLPPGLAPRVAHISPASEVEHARQQRRLLPAWSSATAAAVVLAGPDPHLHWAYLLERLAAPGATAGGLSGPWRERAWLPRADGGALALGQLLRIDSLDAEIEALAPHGGYEFAGPGNLLPAFCAHPVFPELRQLARSGSAALPALGRLMAAAGWSVGRAARSGSQDWSQWLPVLAAIPALPAWGLIARAAAVTSVAEVESLLLPVLGQPLARATCEQALAQIAGAGVVADTGPVFALYLQEWSDSDPPAILRAALAGLRLPNAAGEWVAAGGLVLGVAGAQPAQRLDELLGEPLAGIAVDNRGAADDEPVDGVPGATAGRDLRPVPASLLEAYVEPLAASGMRQAMGAVLGLLGRPAQALARHWLAPIAWEDYLGKLGWRDPGTAAGPALESLVVDLELLHGGQVPARSLTGAELLVELEPAGGLRTLLVRCERRRGGGRRVVLRPAEALLGREAGEQREVLRRTAEALLRELHGQPRADLAALFALFDEADQVTLDVARSLVLEGLPQSLRALPGIGREPRLAAALAGLDEARRNAASARRAGLRAGAREGVERALAGLAHLVETDPAVQAAVLEGIRARVAHHQYELAGIPFELFQNADDAVVELQALQQAQDRPGFDAESVGRFVVQAGAGLLHFAHWGRPVNHAGAGAAWRPDHANDLERMLMLGATAKGETEGLTGKFGLGFKSVLLASANPRVWSADLCFDVVGGCLPRRWIPGEAALAFLRGAQAAPRRGLRPTVIELPLQAGVAAAEVLERFAGLAGLLPVFARQLRNVVVGERVHAWQPALLPLARGARVEVGSVWLPFRGGGQAVRLLVLRGAHGAAVLRLGAGGVEEFERAASPMPPALWVTVPTRGSAARGLLVNAAFEVDTGRASLSQGKAAAARNVERAQGLAHELAPALIELLRRSQTDWAGLASMLGFDPLVVSPARFWAGLWRCVLGDAPGESAAADLRLVDRFACALLRRVAEASGKVPNALPGSAAAMVDLERINLSVGLGYLGGALEPLARWEAFRARHPVQGWCADVVSDWLQRCDFVVSGRLPLLGREQVLAVLPQGRLAPEAVPRLAEVLAAWLQAPGAALGWRKDLAGVRLRSCAGDWVAPQELLRGGEADAGLLLAFAPLRARLDPAYEAAPGQSFDQLAPFLPSWQADAAVLADWCLQAQGTDAQASALRWLLRHAYEPVVDELRARRPAGGWLFGFAGEGTLQESLTAAERLLLRSKLGVDDGPEAVESAAPPPAPGIEAPRDCPFCQLPPERVLHQTALTRTLRELTPISPGHTLVVPLRHIESFFDATPDEQAALLEAVGLARRELLASHGPDGFHIGIREGAVAGRAAPHLHLHLIPRYTGERPELHSPSPPAQDGLQTPLAPDTGTGVGGEGAERNTVAGPS